MPNGLPEAFARQDIGRELFDHRIVKTVHAVMHRKAKVGLFSPPLHRRDHALVAVIEEAHLAAIEGGRLIQERLDRFRPQVGSMAREEKPRAVLPIDLIPHHRRYRVGAGDGRCRVVRFHG